MASIATLSRHALVLAVAASVAALGGCSMPKVLQEPFEQGVYEEILERQAEGIAIEDEELKELPAMKAGDYERLGDTYVARGQLARAVGKYQKALDLDPRSWRLEYKIGTVLLRQGAASDALPYFRAITARDASNARGWEGEGRCLLALKEYQQAEAALKKATRLDAGNWKAQQSLGMLYADLGRYDDAIVSYRAALKSRPVEASILNNLGVAYYLKKDYGQSIEILERALQTARPEDRKRIYNNLGRAHARSGSYSRAVDAFRRGSDLATAYNNVGVILLEEEKPAEAAGCFEKAIKASPSHYEVARENLALAKDRSGGRRSGSACD